MVTLQQSGGDYSTLLAAITANETVIDILGTWTVDDNPGATTMVIDGGNPTTVTAVGASRHAGVPHAVGDTHYRLRKLSNGGNVFQLNDNLTLIGIDERAIQWIALVASTNVLTMDSCVAGVSNTTSDLISWTSGGAAEYYFTNCGLYDGRLIAAHTGLQPGVIEFKNCVAFNTGTKSFIELNNDQAGMTVLLQDTGIELATTTDPVIIVPAGDLASITIDNCKTNSDDWSDNGTPTLVNSELNIAFTDILSPGPGRFWIVESTVFPYDLRLQSSAANIAQNAHSTTTGRPSVDIIGTARPQGANFDLGIWEIPIALPPAYGIAPVFGTLPPAYGVVASGTLPPAYPPET